MVGQFCIAFRDTTSRGSVRHQEQTFSRIPEEPFKNQISGILKFICLMQKSFDVNAIKRVKRFEINSFDRFQNFSGLNHEGN